MAEMGVPCFTRDEQNGLHVIFPIEGRMKQNCLIVNESVEFVYGLLDEGAGLDGLVGAYENRALEQYRAQAATGPNSGRTDAAALPPDPEKIRFDLFRTLMMLQDHDICDFSDEQLVSLLPSASAIPGSTQILPISMLVAASAFLTESLAGDRVRPFYSVPRMERLHPEQFKIGTIVRRHLTQEDVHFVHLDEAGEIDVCSMISGFVAQPQSLRVDYVAARSAPKDDFIESVGSHLASVFGLLSVVTLSATVRLQYPTGADADVHLDESFMDVLGDLGFRKAFDLPEELGTDSGVVGYDKTLF